MIADEKPISGGTWFYKRIYPALMIVFLILWTGLVVVNGFFPLGPWVGGVAILIAPGLVVAGVYREVQQAVLLKAVSLGAGYLRVSDSTTETTISLASVEAVTQTKIGNMRNRATVTLREPASFGDRFTFMPKGARRTPHFTKVLDDLVVIELRERVALVRGDGKKPRSPTATDARSLMADKDLDGPFTPTRAR